MRFEVWSLLSGNQLAIFPDIERAFAWLAEVRFGEGDGAIASLSLDDTESKWGIEGDEILRALQAFPWRPAGWQVITGVAATPEWQSPLVVAVAA